ncbi:hypothetical protein METBISCDRAFT_18321 [Metschnikowia bicuspidata]|uniref:S-adenosyl-L-methionine-dependent methyltransferase n=1 Tax=Metschnikowia bicuspidata TaxID=27322 RepID=A0A4V1J2S6_9ASCO|nr:hypothetical protein METBISCDRAFT_18321 [Metschnikowia bicuspidata]
MSPFSPSVLLSCLRLRIPPQEYIECVSTTELQTEEVQRQVLAALRDILLYNAYYVKRFLGQYICVLESAGDVDEDLYELYCSPTVLNAQELSPTQTDLLEYTVGNGVLVKIQETPRVISAAGTTGLRTWEAALYLLNYLNGPGATLDLRGKAVVELGAGTGLVSMALLLNYRRHRFASLAVTDGNTALLSNFRHTMELNSPTHEAEVTTQQLVRGSSDTSTNIVLGADVTYDSLVLPLLCETIRDFLCEGTQLVLIAATVRSLDTILVWEQLLSQKFQWGIAETLSDPHQSNLPYWFRKGMPDMRIYEITGCV